MRTCRVLKFVKVRVESMFTILLENLGALINVFWMPSIKEDGLHLTLNPKVITMNRFGELSICDIGLSGSIGVVSTSSLSITCLFFIVL